MINKETLFLNFPQKYFLTLVDEGKISNIKSYKDGSFRLIKGENSILIDVELFETWASDEGIKVPDHKHLVRLVEYCIVQLTALDNKTNVNVN